MKKPPFSMKSFDLRRCVHLVAFVSHEILFPEHPTEDPFFLGMYCLPHRGNTDFYIVLVNEDGLKQRNFMCAGDSFEFALLVASGMFPVKPTHWRDLMTVTDRRLFFGHLKPEMNQYRTVLKLVKKRLTELQRHYWTAEHSRSFNR